MRAGVGLGHAKDDGLARELAGLVLEADVHDLLPLAAQGVAVADLDLDLGAAVVEGVGIEPLLDEGVAVLLGEIDALDAAALEPCLRLIEAEIDEVAVLHRLLIFVEKGREIAVAIEDPEGVAVDEVGRSRGEADLRASKYSMTSVKRLKMERCASSKMIKSKKPGLNFSKQRLRVCSVATKRRFDLSTVWV